MTTDAERLSHLEGAYEHLATKADLHALETRITAAMASQTRWMIGLMLSTAVLAAAIAGIIVQVAGS